MSRQRAMVIKKLLADFFKDSVQAVLPQEAVAWHDYSLTDVADHLAPLIIWEVFELAFRRELLALDCILRPRVTRQEQAQREEELSQIFPSHNIHTVVYLPTTHSDGLFAPLPQRRIQALNAFRQVLMYWPKCPSTIVNARPLNGDADAEAVDAMEYALASFYIQQFVEESGRPPLLPHLLPPSSRETR